MAVYEPAWMWTTFPIFSLFFLLLTLMCANAHNYLGSCWEGDETLSFSILNLALLHGHLGSEGDPEYTLFTLNPYLATSLIDI